MRISIISTAFTLLVLAAGCGSGKDQSNADAGNGDGQPTPSSVPRRERINNLKQIALGMQMHHDTYRRLPPPGELALGTDGKPLLSWRVWILPYIEKGNLFNQFKMDEPWDSDHNKKLLDQMPEIYKTTNDTNKTTLMTFVGNGALFDGGKGPKFSEVVDGTRNTIMVVEAGADKAVYWTKPEDLPFDPQNPKAALGDVGPEFLAAFADGRARAIKSNISDDDLKAIITKKGGEIPPEL
ncbi:MAG: DUF1559 domain-containing protein [Planctomycetes bacterium]|nr:DUF1559 domain-containing protein [Planctomycetota bacterium]